MFSIPIYIYIYIYKYICAAYLVKNAEVQILYEEAFLKNARLSHMVFCLGYHPKYLGLFIKTLDFIMNSDGPLSLDIRNYLAILVSIIPDHLR